MTKSKQTGMTDNQIEEFIYSEIKRKGITFYDMISGIGGVDPDPDNKETDSRNRVRINRFSSLSEDTRMLELLADLDCSYMDHFPPFRISSAVQPSASLSLIIPRHCSQAAVPQVSRGIFSHTGQ